MASRHGVAYLGQTNTAILNGTEDLSVWSDEELIRGQRRARNGKWMGRRPKVVPKAVHNELVRRTLSRAHEVLRDSLVDAVTLFADVVRDEEAPLRWRMEAAKVIADRVLGKAPEKVTLQVEPRPYEQVQRVVIERDFGDTDEEEIRRLAAMRREAIEAGIVDEEDPFR